MKKVFKVIYLIPIYFLLIILNNLRVVFNNYSNNTSLIGNIKIFDIKILMISTFLVISFIILNSFKKNKYIFISFSIITFGISFLNGIFVDKNLINYIILYFYLIFATILISKIIKQPFQLIPLFFVCFFIFIMTILGMLNLLKFTKYIILLSAIILIIGLIYLYTKDKESVFKPVNNFIILIFSVLFLIFICGGINRYVHVYDEYSQWGFEPQATIYFNELSTSENIMSVNRNYPPAMTLWHYFMNIFIQSTNESHLYIGLSLFILISLLPCFIYYNDKKGKLITTLFSIIIYFSCSLFGGIYNYTNLYADYAISAVFASSIVISYYFKNDQKNLLKYLCIILGLVCLIKPTGIILAGCLILIKILEDIYEKNEYKSLFKNFKTNIYFVIKKWWKVVLILIGVFVLWNVYVKISDKFNYNFYNFTLLPPSLDTSLSSKMNYYSISMALKNFMKSFSDNILYGIINVTLYQFILIIVFTGIIILHCKKQNVKRIIPYIIGFICFVILTFLSIFVTFTKYEAELLSSFGRYLDSFNFAVFILLIVALYKMLSDNDDFNKKKIIYVLFIYAIILVNIPLKKLTYFVYDYNTERAQTLNVSNDRREKFKLINENTPNDSKIYILDQTDEEGIMAMWYARYYCFPRKVNASSKVIGWKIRTSKNIEDLQDWGFNANTFSDHLLQYNFDYVFLYTYDEEIFKELRNLFDENYLNLYQNYRLFKIERNGVSLKLNPIK